VGWGRKGNRSRDCVYEGVSRYMGMSKCGHKMMGINTCIVIFLFCFITIFMYFSFFFRTNTSASPF
jgi:hypothetical protein